MAAAGYISCPLRIRHKQTKAAMRIKPGSFCSQAKIPTSLLLCAENAHSESCNGLLRADSPIPSDQVTEDSIVFEVPGSSEDTAQLLSSSDIRNGGVATGNGGMSVVSAAFLITNAALGAGLLNFPLAFHEAGGIVPGNVVHMVR
ncbi:hypothetical protein FHG87_022838 [Trinorchestia longiramus]|nr:hypothetical protein FHG87_022838 [Trinorchestia longiramus]